MNSIGGIIRAGLTEGRPTETILADVKAQFPQANTKAASVAWYRSQMKKGGEAAPPSRQKPLVDPSTLVLKSLTVIGDNHSRPAGEYDFVHGIGFVPKATSPLYGARSIKSTMGPEGPGFTCSIFRGSKRVAEVADFGNRGPIRWNWLDRNSPAEVIELNYKDEEVKLKGTREEAMFSLFCRQQPKYRMGGSEYSVSMDVMAENLVNEAFLVRQIRSMVKGKIAIIDGDKLYTVKTAPAPEAILKARAKYPDAKILNEMTEVEQLAAVRALQS